jgi:hypothetical protein
MMMITISDTTALTGASCQIHALVIWNDAPTPETEMCYDHRLNVASENTTQNTQLIENQELHHQQCFGF